MNVESRDQSLIHALIDRPVSEFVRANKTWNAIKFLYNKLQFEVHNYSKSVKPFSIKWVSPDEIQYITGREYKPWANKAKLIGSVKAGDWDKKSMDVEHHPRKIDDWAIFRSCEKHFDDNTPWVETDYYDIHRKRGRSHTEAIHYASIFDKIFNIIKNDGYKSQKQLYMNRTGRNSVRSAILDEVAVDVSRDGELLFVDGRHRLFAAKILNLKSIPVVVLVRHEQSVK